MKTKIFWGYPEPVEETINLWLAKVDPDILSVTQSEYSEGGLVITFIYYEGETE